MALSIASKGAVTTSSTATLSTASFTPAAGAVLVVSYFGFLNAIGTVSISDNFGDTGGGSWTPFTGNFTTTTGTFQQSYGGWYRVIGTGASAGTTTVSASGWTGGNHSLCVDQVTTSSGTLSVPQTNCVAASFSATGSVSLGSAPNSASLVWSGAGCGQSGRTSAVTTSGFTLLDRVNTTSSNATYYINTAGPTTVAWNGLSASQTNALVACEVAVTTSGGSVTANATAANVAVAAPNASARVAPPPGNYSLFQTTTSPSARSGPASPFSYTGNFIAGVLFTVSRGMWFEGFYYWVAASGQSTSPQKFALWGLRYNTTTFTTTGVLLASATSGTLTAGAWNYVPLSAPVQLATGGTYVAQTGVNGNYPRSLSEFSTGVYANGLTSGPLFAFGAGNTTAWPAGPFTWIGGSVMNGAYSTAGNDPTVTLATTNSNQNENLWMDVLVSDFPPSGFSNYRIWPNNPDCWKYSADDASPYNIATEFNISVTCQLQRIWYFSPPGVATLGSSCSLWTMTSGGLAGSVVAGTLNSSPTWLHPDGSAASPGDGWVYCDYSTAAIYLPAGNYKVSVANTNNVTMGAKAVNYWDLGPGQAGILTGPITAPGLSTASQAYNYNGGIPGSTPPFTDGTTVQGQSTFSRNVSPGTSATYPSLFVVGIAQCYWVDIELTPPPVLNVSGAVANVGVSAPQGVAGGVVSPVPASVTVQARSPSVNTTSSATAVAGVAQVTATAAAPSVSTSVPTATAIAGVANVVALAQTPLITVAGGTVVAVAGIATVSAVAGPAVISTRSPFTVYTFTPPTLTDTPAIAYYDRAMRQDGTVTSEWRVDRANPLGFRLFQWFKQRPQGVAIYKMSDGTWRSDRAVPGITTQTAWPPVPIDQQVNGAINQSWYAGRMVNDYVQDPAIVTVYYGGMSYRVDETEADALIAGGFGAYVTTEVELH